MDRILITPLSGRVNKFDTIENALQFLDQYQIDEPSDEFRKYEVHIETSNGDRYQASFSSKQKVQNFLAFVAKK